ncbi:MAG: hypothetical protein AAFY26_04185 [Cyanobacteria bacterium J06638_22]
MRLIQKILIGFMFLIGVPVLLLGVSEWVNPNADAEDKDGATAAIIFLGLPPTALGGFLLWNLRANAPKDKRNPELEREQHFLDLLQANEGRLTPIRVAAEMNMTIAEAKIYLDQKAKQLNATFDVSEEGGIIYRFHV